MKLYALAIVKLLAIEGRTDYEARFGASSTAFSAAWTHEGRGLVGEAELGEG